MNENFSPFYVMDAFARMSITGGMANDLVKEINAAKVVISTHDLAVQAIAGALLQIAKQGISLIHGQPNVPGVPVNAPLGRQIGPTGTIFLRDVVWAARNQALHYEDGNFAVFVTNTFNSLEVQNGALYSLTTHQYQSRAKQIIELLGWVTCDAYFQDMKSLGL